MACARYAINSLPLLFLRWALFFAVAFLYCWFSVLVLGLGYAFEKACFLVFAVFFFLPHPFSLCRPCVEASETFTGCETKAKVQVWFFWPSLTTHKLSCRLLMEAIGKVCS